MGLAQVFYSLLPNQAVGIPSSCRAREHSENQISQQASSDPANSQSLVGIS